MANCDRCGESEDTTELHAGELCNQCRDSHECILQKPFEVFKAAVFFQLEHFEKQLTDLEQIIRGK